MNNRPLVSLCIPTNGVVQWIFPVLDSIYNQNVNNELFEVVITDNGNNQEFKDEIREFMKVHSNIVYAETEALPFINEIEAYKRATGEFIKFVNHRTRLVDGALLKLINYVKSNSNNKPITYFSNGVIPVEKKVYIYDSFDGFVQGLWYWSSWSTGMAIWKSDFDKLPDDVSDFNELFPHMNVLFNERHRARYIIDNTIIFDEIPQGKKPKGSYDLYYAFGVEYPSLIESLLDNGDITLETYKFVLDKNLDFISQLYWEYNFRKHYCSYDLSGLENMFGKYYTRLQLTKKLLIRSKNSIKNKLIGFVTK